MPLVINTNIASLQAQQNIASTQEKLRASFQKLSSGFRINTASDDASGLAISESMTMQIRGYAVAERNANNAISVTQVVESAIGQTISILQRMRDLAVQSSNGDLTSTDRGYINTEFGQLRSEIDRILYATKFNGTVLAGTSAAASITFQVGTGTTASVDQITLSLMQLGTTGIGMNTTTVDSFATAQQAITNIDAAVGTTTLSGMAGGLNGVRATYGAMLNRFQSAVSQIQSIRTNLSAANSRIRDVDVAEETAQLARNQVLAQAGASVLAQANQAPQLALSLLR